MKKKTHSHRLATAKKSPSWQFDSTEFLLLTFVAMVMLIFFSWQTGLLSGIAPLVLGVSTSR